MLNYTQLEQTAAAALSQDIFDIAKSHVESAADMATSGIDMMYRLAQDLGDKMGSLPTVDSKQDKDSWKAGKYDNTNTVYHKYYERGDNDKPKQMDYFDQLTGYTSEGKAFNERLEALAVVKDNKQLPAKHKHADEYNVLSGNAVAIEEHMAYWSGRYKTLKNLIVRGTALWQQLQEFYKLPQRKENPDGSFVPGMRLDTTEGVDGTYKSTLKPIYIEDSRETPMRYKRLTIGAFLAYDFAKVLANGGTWSALNRADAVKEPTTPDGKVSISLTSSAADMMEGLETVMAWWNDPQHRVDLSTYLEPTSKMKADKVAELGQNRIDLILFAHDLKAWADLPLNKTVFTAWQQQRRKDMTPQQREQQNQLDQVEAERLARLRGLVS